MSRFTETIEVGVPVRAAYEQLTEFESYPEFMTGVQQVTQLSDTETHWVMNLDGRRREFDAHVVESRPDQRVAWEAAGGLLTEAITLKRVGLDRTQVTCELDADARALLPGDAHPKDALGRLLKADMSRLKSYLERQVGPVHAI
jgi:uncharacterized membrane protein